MISIHAISTGKIQDLPYSRQKTNQASALDKTKISQTTWLSSTGFTGDKQAYKDHGGPHKAVCGFSKHNYALYRDDLPSLPTHAMFGDLTFDSLDESDVYFGNQYRLGDALIEVSEIREPCWKIQAKYNIPDLVKRMSTSGKTGFYFRVLKQGYVSPNDQLYLIQEPPIEHHFFIYYNNLMTFIIMIDKIKICYDMH